MPLWRRQSSSSATELAEPRAAPAPAPAAPAAPPPPPPCAPRPRRASSGVAAHVQARLAAEVLRKLRLATEADGREARDVVCAEVFADVTGELNAAARESTGALYSRWYEVLAPHFCARPADAEALLVLCRQLWGQPFAAPLFALLAHQWLLVHADAGGADQRLKHVTILALGARQLFLGDAETGNAAFRPLHAFFAEAVALRPRLDALPPPAREAVARLAAAFFPYYYPPRELPAAAAAFPPRAAPPPGGPPPPPGEGADFFLEAVVDALARDVRAEGAALRYLAALCALAGSPVLAALRTSTRVRLQGEVYALTQPGGPRYASRAVNRAAFAALDALFPHGRRTRRLVNLAFRVLHPQEWPWVWWDAAAWWARGAAAALAAAAARAARWPAAAWAAGRLGGLVVCSSSP